MFDATLGFQGYPAGAIKTQAELQDIVTEARKEKKAIRLYEVSQGGHFSELFITSKTRIEPGKHSPDIMGFEYFRKASWGDKRLYKTHGCLGDLNITDKCGRRGGHNRHMLFSNRELARRYAQQLSTDKQYLAAVERHHAECDRLFSRIVW